LHVDRSFLIQLAQPPVQAGRDRPRTAAIRSLMPRPSATFCDVAL
jgi:hypothetical protein